MSRASRLPAGLPAGVALWSAISAYAAGFAALSVLRHRSFETGRFDLGNMVQAVWSTAHGRPLAITDLHGEQTVRLAAHVDPVLVVFAPLWWLWPAPSLLLTVQAIAIALGALPVFWLARKHLGSERAALGFALAYLAYPAVQWLTLNEFHAVALACPLLLFAFWYLDERRLPPFAAFALVAAATKEQIPLVLAGLGLWYALARGGRTAGAIIAALGLAWTAIAVGIVVPHFSDGSGGGFSDRYAEVGGSPGGILETAAADPGRILTEAFDGRGVLYLAELALPLAAFWGAAPLALVAALPELGLNLLSATPTQTSIHFHYTAGAIPPLVVASVLGAARIGRARPDWIPRLGGLALLASLVSSYFLGALPVWRHFPGGERLGAKTAQVSEHDRIAARALRLVPGDAVVSASNSLGAHLSARRRFLSFPFLEDATWVAVDETRPGYSDRIAPVAMRVQVAWLRRDPDWRLVFSADGVLVFRRSAPP
jgi:uncharacterized membrane protein